MTTTSTPTAYQKATADLLVAAATRLHGHPDAQTLLRMARMIVSDRRLLRRLWAAVEQQQAGDGDERIAEQGEQTRAEQADEPLPQAPEDDELPEDDSPTMGGHVYEIMTDPAFPLSRDTGDPKCTGLPGGLLLAAIIMAGGAVPPRMALAQAENLVEAWRDTGLC